MQADQFFVAQHFDPREAVGIGPDRVENSGEVGFEAATAFFEQVRQQERHFMSAQRPFRGVEQFVPALLRRRDAERLGNKFVPGVEIVSALGSHRTGENVQQHQGAHGLPTAKVS